MTRSTGSRLGLALALLLPVGVVAATAGIGTREAKTDAPVAINLTTAPSASQGTSTALAPAGHVHSVVTPVCGAGQFMTCSGSSCTCATPSGGSGTVTSIATTAPILGGTITGTGTISCAVASGSQAGCLAAADWSTFNGKGSGTVTSVTAGTGLTGGTFSTSGTIAASFGSSSGTICEGSDSRLSDSRTPTAHNLLSTAHGDTLAGTVTRGDILRGNSTPSWSRLAIGAANRVLSSDGTDASWNTVPNAALANSSVTVNTNSPLSGGGAVSLGTSLTLSLGTVGVGTGGTGQTSFGSAAGGIITSGTSGTGSLGNVPDVAAGALLTSGGTSSNPAWAATSVAVNGVAPQLVLGAVAASSSGAIDFKGLTSGTTRITVPAAAGSVTVTLPTVTTTEPAANPSTSGMCLQATTAGVQSYAALNIGTANLVTGTLPVGNGGTGGTGFGSAAGALITSGTSGTGALSSVTAAATGSFLASGGTATNPVWSSATTQITQPSWTACTFNTAWKNFDAVNYQPCAYYQDSVGTVHVRGLVMVNSGAACSGTGSTTTACATGAEIFTISPVPALDTPFATVSNDLFGQIRVLHNGKVCCQVGSTSWVSLNGLSFDTR